MHWRSARLADMSAKELLKIALDDAGYQVEQVFAGLKPEQWDLKIESAMSPRETAEHLAHVYEACRVSATGGTWDWAAPWSTGATTIDELLEKMRQGRATAVETVLSSDDLKVHTLGIAFIVSHDAYHVGQLVTFRMAQNDGWNPYSIYNHD